MAMRSIQQTGRRPALDDLDKAIIKRLQLDGRRPYAQIGRELSVPEATVRQRAERLITSGVSSPRSGIFGLSPSSSGAPFTIVLQPID